jgi:hypothetical protein
MEKIKQEKTTVIAGRTIRMGLTVKNCMEKNVKPSIFQAGLNNPIFDDWNFLLRMANLGVIEGEQFTEESNALWLITTAMIVLAGDVEQNKHFLAQRSDNSEEKPPSL